jgi:hypothetical protein
LTILRDKNLNKIIGEHTKQFGDNWPEPISNYFLDQTKQEIIESIRDGKPKPVKGSALHTSLATLTTPGSIYFDPDFLIVLKVYEKAYKNKWLLLKAA